jgi:3-oxoacid CoA-transferase B subunit
MVADSALMNDVRRRIAERTARELRDGELANLGVGIPTLIPQVMRDDQMVIFHSENGVIGFEALDEDAEPNPSLINASKQPIQERDCTSYFDSASSFGMIRGGHIGVAVLGAFQVDETGMVASWHIPGKLMMGVGGAMDLLVGARRVIIAMSHQGPDGSPKLLRRCTLPLTANRPFDVVVTEKATFERNEGRIVLKDLAEGVSLDELRSCTPMAFDA